MVSTKQRTPVAVLGPGNIGTDLLVKLARSSTLRPVLMAGIYADSPGLEHARRLGIAASAEGLEAVLARDDVRLVFDATSAAAHLRNAPRLARAGKRVIDLTPAAVGPFVVPHVNLADHLDAPNVNLISCGGQATIPIVHAISSAAPTPYAEVVATIASRSAGPGTRQNIDEFTRTTADGVERVGGAESGKAIIVLNPAEPPITMRATVYARVRDGQSRQVAESIAAMTDRVRTYVPGYRSLLAEVDDDTATVILEIEGAGDHLPRFAGNLDVMTSAAVRVGEEMAARAESTARRAR
ncbi:MAG: acetaldehyde dehydrogenase (acetylating) [Thermoleophilaceae bacterium]